MGSKFSFYTKKAHRYLGVFIGVQFLLWTIGGLYFSWTDIRQIRGEHLRRESRPLDPGPGITSPSLAIRNLEAKEGEARVTGVSVTRVLDRLNYEIIFERADGTSQSAMADAYSGELRSPITAEEAKQIALNELRSPSEVLGAELIDKNDVGGHHEYRDKPLPAWAVTFAEPDGLVVYVNGNTGRVESLRTTSWRVFDLFWLFHTLDLYGRDNINNYVLRAFSVLGLVTLFSGYLLFAITSPWIRSRRTGSSGSGQINAGNNQTGKPGA